MRRGLLIGLSVAINVVLAILLWRAHSKTARPVDSIDAAAAASTNKPRNSVIVRRLGFTWDSLETEDYTTYVKNLREIGCPEPTIRDIIVADVNQLYARRRSSEVVSADHQWWRSEPDLDSIEGASDQLKNLDEERKALLTRLLGPAWETPAQPVPPPARTGITLSGPVLGELSGEAKRAIYDLTARAQQRMDAYVQNQAQSGRELDDQELARFRQQTRTELAQHLSPAQMEEFLLRYSKTSQQLREEFGDLNLNPAEFRALFRVQDPLDQQMEIYFQGSSTGAERERKLAEARREAAVREILGPERYQSYKLSRDPEYASIREQAVNAGLPSEAVLPLHQINQLTERTRTGIENDGKLTAEEKASALRDIGVQQQQSLERLLGTELLQRYQQQERAR